MQNKSLTLLILFLKALEIVYYKDFTPSFTCPSIFSSNWSIVSGSFSGGSCSYTCTRTDNSGQARILSPDMSDYPNGLQMKTSLTSAYSFFGVDLVYLQKIDSLNMSILDGNQQLFNQNYSGASTGANIEYNYRLSCSAWSGNMQVSKEYVQMNQSLSSNQVTIKFKQVVTDGFSWYGILKLRVWANCVENCNICQDSTNCSTCIQGFDRYILPSGQKVCEQTNNCNISNCHSCIKSSPSSPTATCVKCLPGYTLDANKNCIANSGGACSTNQYRSTTSVCESYSTQCYMQKQNTYYTWQNCPSQVNLSQYRCLQSQSILIFEHKNYSLFTCGCPINNCIQCPTPVECSACDLGFTFDANKQKCIFVTCPILFTRDPQTGLCQRNCSGDFCQECDSNQKCTLCSSMGNYYVVTANPINCAQCTIQNCAQCSGEGLCQKCQNLYSLSPDRSACNACNVDNCSQCISGSANLCQTCQTGYILDSSQTICSCSVQNCQSCNIHNGEICDFCQNGYLISSDQKQCQCGVPNCSQCLSLNGSQCQNCISGYSITPTKDNCLCSVNNCQTCNSSNGNLCDSCIINYAPVGTQSSTCSCQVYGCQECEPLNGLQCKICSPNFTLSNGQCLCNVANCRLCSSTDGKICSQCENNYLKNSQSTSCDCQVNSCNQCDSSDGKICLSPKPGYTYDPISQTNKCNFPNCLNCDPNDGTICLQCKNGFNFVSNKCECNVKNCLVCNSSDGNLCDSCIMNYTPAGKQSSTCSCQAYGCQECDPQDGLKCKICHPNFTLSNGQCLCNVANCSLCSSTDGNICSQCVKDYQKNSQNTSCSCQVNSCNTCDQNDGKICISPKPGYTYDPISQTNQCNFPNCLNCDANDGKICLQCINGFNFTPTKCECNVQKCQQCSSQDGNTCQKCLQNYHLNPVGQSIQCQLNCDLDNCLECQDPPNNLTQCKICQTGYILDQNTNQCVSTKCNVPMCKQCQEFKTNICQICNDRYNLNSSYQCILSVKNDFTVQQTVIQNVGYDVTLVFQNQIVNSSQNFSQKLNVVIQNYDNPFQVSIQQVQEKQIKLQLKLSDNCKNKNLVVQMNDQTFVQINNLVDPEKQVKLNEYVVLSQSQIQQAQQTKEVASGTSSSLLIMMILMVVIGNTYVLFSTIDLTTFIYFMLFVDVRYPDNVISFCSIFQNFQFAFIPNSIQVYFMDTGYTQPFTPQKFIDNGYDAYFFNGAGQSYTIIVGIMIIYGVLKILTYIPITSVKVYIQSKIKSGWEYCGFFDLVGCVYVYVLISCLLQFYCFQFDESLAFINYSLFSLTFIFVIIYPIMVTIFIKKCKNLNDPKIQLQFGSLIGGLVIPNNEASEEQNNKNKNNLNESANKISNENSSQQKIEEMGLTRQKQLQQKWSRYTNVILYTRKIVYMMVLLYLYGHVYLQMIIINSMNLFLSIYYLYVQPQDQKSVNLKNGISEVLLTVMQVTICFLVTDDENESEQDRYNVGWIIVGSASLILAIHIFSVVVDLLKGIYNLVKDFICTLIKPKAEIERLKQEKLKEEEQNKQNKFLRLASQISIDKLRGMKKKLSLVPQSQLDLSIISTQRHQIKSKSIILQPKTSENIELIQMQKQQDKVNKEENRDQKKDEENQLKKSQYQDSSFEQKSSPKASKINQQILITNTNINNQTQPFTHRLFSAPQSINISQNDLMVSKINSQVLI